MGSVLRFHSLNPSLVLRAGIDLGLDCCEVGLGDDATRANVREGEARLSEALEVSDRGSVSSADPWLTRGLEAIADDLDMLVPELQVFFALGG